MASVVGAATRMLVESNGRHTAKFHFPSTWTAWKYDDEDDPHNCFYRSKVKKSSNVSAVDFVAHDEERDALVLIECKDFRGSTRENMPRLSDALSEDESTVARFIKERRLSVSVTRAKPYLPREFAKNLRDTLIGLCAAARANDPALGGLSTLLSRGKRLVCVLSFELDPLPSWQPGEGARLLSKLKTAIETEVGFLQNVEVVICSTLHPPAHNYAWRLEVSG